MSDDSLIDDTERDKRKKMAVIVGGTLVALQLLFLFTFRSYLDFGHIFTTIAFLLLALFAFWSLKQAKIIPVILCIVAASGLLFLSLIKVKWNESYLQGLTTANAFVLEDYIEKYPTLEEHFFSRTLGKKDWIRLAERCVEPALNQRPVYGFCRDPSLIKEYYRIDIQEEIDTALSRMQRTARDIESGRISNAGQYRRCIAEKRCAPIPLLPGNVEAQSLANDSTQYVDVRQAFWDLVEGRGMTPQICAAMTLCRAMMAIGVVQFDMPILPPATQTNP
jgi:hypothetical protein